MKIAIVFIGTSKYKQFFDGFYEGIMKNFLPKHDKQIFVFSDDVNDPIFDKLQVTKKMIQHQCWPFITLHRFKFIRLIEEELKNFDYAFFVDADLWCVDTVEDEEFFGDPPLYGVQHPGYIGKIGAFETDTRSNASIFEGYYDVKIYRQGCFWGGKIHNFLSMIRELDEKIDEDSSKGIVAIWHDESHMNKYFLLHHEDVLTLHSGFAQPQFGWEHLRDQFPTKFVHIVKNDDDFPRFSGVKQNSSIQKG